MSKETNLKGDDPKNEELTDPWRTPCIEHEFDISGSAIVHEHSQDLLNRARDIMNGKWDVMIQRQIGHMPRKMKKAKHANYRRATKWKRKLAAHILRRSFVLRNAELVLSISRQKMLQAMISGGRIDHCCDISADDLLHPERIEALPPGKRLAQP